MIVGYLTNCKPKCLIILLINFENFLFDIQPQLFRFSVKSKTYRKYI